MTSDDPRIVQNGDAYLYVVLLVARMHHAVVYEIPTAAAPENAIANRRKSRVSGGLPKQALVFAYLAELSNTYKLRTRFS